jgi:integrase
MKTINSTPATPAGKPPARSSKEKPRHPLFLHATGQWAKKVNGRLHYFGKDRDRALSEWLRCKDALLAGRPRPPENASDSQLTTLQELCNKFLANKEVKVSINKMKRRSWADYQVECARMVKILGASTPVDHLTESDFDKLLLKISKGVSHKTVEGRVVRCRAVFRFGEKRRHTGPVLYRMEDFTKPTRADIEREKPDAVKAFDASEIRLLVSSAGVNMQAMILLAINCGLGNTDIAALTEENFDFENRWLIKRREKTGKFRRIPLWKETIEAVQAALKSRKPKSQDCPYVFLTKQGNPFVQPPKELPIDEQQKTRWTIGANPISSEFRKLRTSLGIDQKQKTFYALRHSFKSVGENATGNNIAVDYLMGHSDSSVSGIYRQYILDERLIEVTEAVHKWLFASPSKPPKAIKARKESK